MSAIDNRLLNVLSKLANRSFQRDVWVNQSFWDEALNYSEAVNLLDDYFFFDAVKEGRIQLPNNDEQRKLEDFIVKLLDYDESIEAADMLADPKWIEITKLAGEVLEGLKKI